MSLGTNSQVVMKLDLSPTSEGGPAVELIAIGPIGSDNKMAGVYTWHRIPSFKNLEWENVRNSNGNVAWIEISDCGRLIKIINSIIGLSTSITDEINCEINVRITGGEMNLSNPTPCSFALPVRWFDPKWAAATFVYPRISKPRACVKLVAGLDQLATILKRADRWKKEEWAIEVLEVAVSEDFEDVWNVVFVAETSSPPIVRLQTNLPHCPVHRLPGIESFEPCRVAVNLGAATRALFVPLAENSRLAAAMTGVSLMWIPGESLIGTVNWSSFGVGLIYTTIYIPSRIN